MKGKDLMIRIYHYGRGAVVKYSNVYGENTSQEDNLYVSLGLDYWDELHEELK